MVRGRRRRRAARAVGLAVAIPLVSAACGEQSRVDPNAKVHIVGSVLAADGTPLANRPVHLGAGISDGDVGLAIFTVGLSCTTGACHGKEFDASTGGDGAYAFTLLGSDSQSTFGEAVSELVTASGAPGAGQVSGAAVSARFRIQVEEVRLPTLQLVDPAVRVTPSAAAVAVEWSTPAPGPYTVTFEDGSALPVWQATVTAPALGVDPRVLEDTGGRVVVAGGSTDRIEGSDVDIHWRSPGFGYAGIGVPPSRGRRCDVVMATDVPSPVERCALTDGDLVGPAVLPAGATAADVDLGDPVPAELVVVRGCPSTCDVSVSTDGTTFASVGAASAGDSVVALDGSPVSFVRIGLDPAAPAALREVSVWGPAPAPVRVPSNDLGDLRDRFGSGSDGGGAGGRTIAIAVAAVLAAGTLLAVGFLFGARRRSQSSA